MGILFEVLNDPEELACNFYSSTASPDNQAGTGVPPCSPGPRRATMHDFTSPRLKNGKMVASS
jgi:hypothetical protein